MTPVFVYGTLKRGGINHSHLDGQKFLGPARTIPGFTLYLLDDFPGMVRESGSREGVNGELWLVDRKALERLDQLEGINEGLYERVPISLEAPYSEQPAETYLYLRSLDGKVRLGDSWPGGTS